VTANVAGNGIWVDGLFVEIRYKAVKRAHLHVVGEGEIWAAVPYGASAAIVTRLLRNNRRWVDNQLVASARSRIPRIWGQPLLQQLDADSLHSFYRGELQARISGLAGHWLPLVGRTPKAWSLRWMKTRWGSCSPPSGRVTVNIALALLEARFLEEVLVHELVHLHHSNHGPLFKAMMDRLLPSWRSTARELAAIKPAPDPRKRPHTSQA
jgi:predicted metal-dependent hydrolase